ncbi:hypothetical protein CYY_007602 [Polysphondylium violaceum]|uniref:Uncharacterized protein n=1 Tax=Polysphondylium violaceum TaxID=133409 RepID=A0A8J4PX05_9MYCE|nr:hypothetical protein CYY_007602 [Polysphondylium violaceum]
MTVSSLEQDITIQLLPGTENSINWVIIKDNFNLLETNKVHTNTDSEADRGSFTFKCVTTYDSGVYKLKQRDPTNTGYNLETAIFNLSVVGDNLETLQLVKPPSHRIISGSSFSQQPIIAYGREQLPDWMGESQGSIEPFIVSSPSNGAHLHYAVQYQKNHIDRENKQVKFAGLTILGEPGYYTIGFVDSDTCEIFIYPHQIRVFSVYTDVVVNIILAIVLALGILVLSLFIRILGSLKTNSRPFISFRLSVIAQMDAVLKSKGEALTHYFKAQRILIFQTTLFALIALALLVPVTIHGDNNFKDLYYLSQTNWKSDSPYLFLYQGVVFCIFISLIMCFYRFNQERISLSHDNNHLVTSRTVLLTGLPKSLINASMLKDFLQTSYSNGIYALNIVLQKSFTNQDKINDLNGRVEFIYNNNNQDNIGDDEKNSPNGEPGGFSTGTAFITFSCVSDAHLFKTQYSPHQWKWAKGITPIPPDEYQKEMNISNWKSYNVPFVSDILWTKLHNLSSYHSTGFTIFLLSMTTLIFSAISFTAILIYDSQFSNLYKSNPANIELDNIAYTICIYFIYLFIPMVVLLVNNRLIPIIIHKIMIKSNLFVRSSLKSKILIFSFLIQSLAIFLVPSFYFLMIMNPSTHIFHPNSFIYPINFFRTGGIFFTNFTILFGILSPFYECSESPLILYNWIFKRRTMKTEEIFKFSAPNLIDLYSNSLLMVLMICCYAPIFPPLFLFGVVYMVLKYFFVKYLAMATKDSFPISDKYLVYSVQNIIWLILVMTACFHFYYVVCFERVDLSFVYIFLFIVGFGRYVPSCSKSLCYSFVDGAELPCFQNESDCSDLEQDDNDDGDESDKEDGENGNQDNSNDKDPINNNNNSSRIGSINNDNSSEESKSRDRSLTPSSTDEMMEYYKRQQQQQEEEQSMNNKQQQQKRSKESTTLNLKQNYMSTIEGGFLSFLFNRRYKLHSPRSMKVTTYLSPFYGKDISQCENVNEEDDVIINDDVDHPNDDDSDDSDDSDSDSNSSYPSSPQLTRNPSQQQQQQQYYRQQQEQHYRQQQQQQQRQGKRIYMTREQFDRYYSSNNYYEDDEDDDYDYDYNHRQ